MPARWIVGIIAIVAVAGVALWHTVASWEFARGGDPTVSLVEQVASARIARDMEPFNTAMVARYDFVRGQLLYRDGDLFDAERALAEAHGNAPSDPDILSFYQLTKYALAETAGKAHLQHGHEGPGGTLRPQDIER